MQENLTDFNDPNFIPDNEYCEAINESSPLLILKITMDGRISIPFLAKKDVDYLQLLKTTKNKFLKLACFDVLKIQIPTNDQNRIMNVENLLPLYYEVALAIVKKKIQRYRPMHLVIDYINQAHPTISGQKIFQDVGTILLAMIKDENKLYVRDISFILKNFLGLKRKILENAEIPESIISAIDFYIFNLFDGNLGHYDTEKTLLERIFNFYENFKIQIDIDRRKDLIYSKYMQFYDDKLNDFFLDINNIQSTESNKQFTEYMLEITQKYSVDPKIHTQISTLRKKIEDLHRASCIAINNLPEKEFVVTFSDVQIQNVLRQFENDTIYNFLQKVIKTEFFLPEIPEHSDLYLDQEITRYIPTRIFDDNTSRSFPAGSSVIDHNCYYKYTAMEYLLYFERKLEDFELYEVIGSIYAFIHLSPVIDLLTRKMFQICLHHYNQKDFFHCIQIIIFQIEHVLRVFCEKKGVLNLYRDEKKTIPKGLDYLIPQLKKEQVLSTKRLYFIEWLLCGSEDMITENIRNKIAHGIASINQYKNVYTKKNALALILIFLCLSKYNF